MTVPNLPQIKMMYRSGMKYSVMVATARIKQARKERNGTVQLNVLQTNHTNVRPSEAGTATYIRSFCHAYFLVIQMKTTHWKSFFKNLEMKVGQKGLGAGKTFFRRSPDQLPLNFLELTVPKRRLWLSKVIQHCNIVMMAYVQRFSKLGVTLGHFGVNTSLSTNMQIPVNI